MDNVVRLPGMLLDIEARLPERLQAILIRLPFLGYIFRPAMVWDLSVYNRVCVSPLWKTPCY